MAEKVNLNAYFERIGFAGSIAPTLATLELLHALHPAVIPFENLDPLLGLPVKLDQQSLERKMLTEKRGGYCFEHNTLLMRMLRDLEFSVTPLLARVTWTNPDAHQMPPSHMLLLVSINGQNYLADVGFGGLTLTTPLRLRAETEQTTPHETFRLSFAEPDWTLEVKLGEDDWRSVYVFTTEAADESTISALSRQISTDPGSAFTRELRVALSPANRRLKLHNGDFSVQPLEGAPEKRTITTLDELRQVLSASFGITLPQDIEGMDDKLAALLPAPEAPPPEAEPAPEG